MARRSRTQGIVPRTLAALLLMSLAGACSRRDHSSAPAPVASPSPTASAARRATAQASSLDLIERLPRCEVDHGGPLIDLGSTSAQGMTGTWSLAADLAQAVPERSGETWVKISARKLQLRFILDDPSPVFVAIRARAGAARSAAVLVDGKPLGGLSLVRGQARVLSTRPSASPFAAGAHTIEVRFTGGPRQSSDPLAEVAWVRAGTWEGEGSFAPPTISQIVANVALSGELHRALALRAPSVVRCSTFVPAGAHLRTSIGFEGVGSGEAELRLVREGDAPPLLLSRQHVDGGERAKWTPVDVALEPAVGKIVTLELRAESARPGGRVLFGDPTLYVARAPLAAAPAARLALIVVMAGVDQQKLGNRELVPAISEFANTAVRFDAHRSPTTVTAAVMASLLTGMPPRAHGVEDAGARLSGALTTLGVAARDGSVQTAMFTGCPTTFDAFGFARGWDKYAAFSPVEGAPAVAPLSEAAVWITSHMGAADARALVVVHARGGHPPWDVTVNEAAKMPPSEYTGALDPRRAAQIIARARAKRTRFRLSDADRTRMWAIYDAALTGQDRAFGALVEALKKAGLWDDTLLVLAADVGLNPDGRAPFGDGEELSESMLHAPLWVHFPGDALAGTQVKVATSTIDIARSALGALKLKIPEGFEGVDLFASASGVQPAAGRSLWATLGARYALRLGDLVLAGTGGKPPSLCDVALDPSCEVDRLERMPRAASLLFREVYDAEMNALKWKQPREPATVDADTSAALQVWGE
jgi:arylsulfatase A-like enzyme